MWSLLLPLLLFAVEYSSGQVDSTDPTTAFLQSFVGKAVRLRATAAGFEGKYISEGGVWLQLGMMHSAIVFNVVAGLSQGASGGVSFQLQSDPSQYLLIDSQYKVTVGQPSADHARATWLVEGYDGGLSFRCAAMTLYMKVIAPSGIIGSLPSPSSDEFRWAVDEYVPPPPSSTLALTVSPTPAPPMTTPPAGATHFFQKFAGRRIRLRATSIGYEDKYVTQTGSGLGSLRVGALSDAVTFTVVAGLSRSVGGGVSFQLHSDPSQYLLINKHFHMSLGWVTWDEYRDRATWVGEEEGDGVYAIGMLSGELKMMMQSDGLVSLGMALVPAPPEFKWGVEEVEETVTATYVDPVTAFLRSFEGEDVRLRSAATAAGFEDQYVTAREFSHGTFLKVDDRADAIVFTVVAGLSRSTAGVSFRLRSNPSKFLQLNQNVAAVLAMVSSTADFDPATWIVETRGNHYLLRASSRQYYLRVQDNGYVGSFQFPTSPAFEWAIGVYTSAMENQEAFLPGFEGKAVRVRAKAGGSEEAYLARGTGEAVRIDGRGSALVFVVLVGLSPTTAGVSFQLQSNASQYLLADGSTVSLGTVDSAAHRERATWDVSKYVGGFYLYSPVVPGYLSLVDSGAVGWAGRRWDEGMWGIELYTKVVADTEAFLNAFLAKTIRLRTPAPVHEGKYIAPGSQVAPPEEGYVFKVAPGMSQLVRGVSFLLQSDASQFLQMLEGGRVGVAAVSDSDRGSFVVERYGAYFAFRGVAGATYIKVGNDGQLAGADGPATTIEYDWEVEEYTSYTGPGEALLRKFEGKAVRLWSKALGWDAFLGSDGQVGPPTKALVFQVVEGLSRLPGGVSFQLQSAGDARYLFVGDDGSVGAGYVSPAEHDKGTWLVVHDGFRYALRPPAADRYLTVKDSFVELDTLAAALACNWDIIEVTPTRKFLDWYLGKVVRLQSMAAGHEDEYLARGASLWMEVRPSSEALAFTVVADYSHGTVVAMLHLHSDPSLYLYVTNGGDVRLGLMDGMARDQAAWLAESRGDSYSFRSVAKGTYLMATTVSSFGFVVAMPFLDDPKYDWVVQPYTPPTADVVQFLKGYEGKTVRVRSYAGARFVGGSASGLHLDTSKGALVFEVVAGLSRSTGGVSFRVHSDPSLYLAVGNGSGVVTLGSIDTDMLRDRATWRVLVNSNHYLLLSPAVAGYLRSAGDALTWEKHSSMEALWVVDSYSPPSSGDMRFLQKYEGGTVRLRGVDGDSYVSSVDGSVGWFFTVEKGLSHYEGGVSFRVAPSTGPRQYLRMEAGVPGGTTALVDADRNAATFRVEEKGKGYSLRTVGGGPYVGHKDGGVESPAWAVEVYPVQTAAFLQRFEGKRVRARTLASTMEKDEFLVQDGSILRVGASEDGLVFTVVAGLSRSKAGMSLRAQPDATQPEFLLFVQVDERNRVSLGPATATDEQRDRATWVVEERGAQLLLRLAGEGVYLALNVTSGGASLASSTSIDELPTGWAFDTFTPSADTTSLLHGFAGKVVRLRARNEDKYLREEGEEVMIGAIDRRSVIFTVVTGLSRSYASVSFQLLSDGKKYLVIGENDTLAIESVRSGDGALRRASWVAWKQGGGTYALQGIDIPYFVEARGDGRVGWGWAPRPEWDLVEYTPPTDEVKAFLRDFNHHTVRIRLASPSAWDRYVVRKKPWGLTTGVRGQTAVFRVVEGRSWTIGGVSFLLESDPQQCLSREGQRLIVRPVEWEFRYAATFRVRQSKYLSVIESLDGEVVSLVEDTLQLTEQTSVFSSGWVVEPFAPPTADGLAFLAAFEGKQIRLRAAADGAYLSWNGNLVGTDTEQGMVLTVEPGLSRSEGGVSFRCEHPSCNLYLGGEGDGVFPVDAGAFAPHAPDDLEGRDRGTWLVERDGDYYSLRPLRSTKYLHPSSPVALAELSAGGEGRWAVDVFRPPTAIATKFLEAFLGGTVRLRATDTWPDKFLGRYRETLLLGNDNALLFVVRGGVSRSFGGVSFQLLSDASQYLRTSDDSQVIVVGPLDSEGARDHATWEVLREGPDFMFREAGGVGYIGHGDVLVYPQWKGAPTGTKRWAVDVFHPPTPATSAFLQLFGRKQVRVRVADHLVFKDEYIAWDGERLDVGTRGAVTFTVVGGLSRSTAGVSFQQHSDPSRYLQVDGNGTLTLGPARVGGYDQATWLVEGNGEYRFRVVSSPAFLGIGGGLTVDGSVGHGWVVESFTPPTASALAFLSGHRLVRLRATVSPVEQFFVAMVAPHAELLKLDVPEKAAEFDVVDGISHSTGGVSFQLHSDPSLWLQFRDGYVYIAKVSSAAEKHGATWQVEAFNGFYRISTALGQYLFHNINSFIDSGSFSDDGRLVWDVMEWTPPTDATRSFLRTMEGKEVRLRPSHPERYNQYVTSSLELGEPESAEVFVVEAGLSWRVGGVSLRKAGVSNQYLMWKENGSPCEITRPDFDGSKDHDRASWVVEPAGDFYQLRAVSSDDLYLKVADRGIELGKLDSSKTDDAPTKIHDYRWLVEPTVSFRNVYGQKPVRLRVTTPGYDSLRMGLLGDRFHIKSSESAADFYIARGLTGSKFGLSLQLRDDPSKYLVCHDECRALRSTDPSFSGEAATWIVEPAANDNYAFRSAATGKYLRHHFLFARVDPLDPNNPDFSWAGEIPTRLVSPIMYESTRASMLLMNPSHRSFVITTPSGQQEFMGLQLWPEGTIYSSYTTAFRDSNGLYLACWNGDCTLATTDTTFGGKKLSEDLRPATFWVVPRDNLEGALDHQGDSYISLATYVGSRYLRYKNTGVVASGWECDDMSLVWSVVSPMVPQ